MTIDELNELNELKSRVLQQINLTDQTESLCWDECCNLAALIDEKLAEIDRTDVDVQVLDEFMDALFHCDTVKVILVGCGETVFSTKEIHEAITALRQKPSGWIPVSERLPTMADGIVLAWSSKLDKWQAEEWSYVISGSKDNYTHWMPLPELPKKGE